MNDNLKLESHGKEEINYRVNDMASKAAFKEPDFYKNDSSSDEMEEADDDSAYEIVMLDSDTYVSNIHVPALFFGKIIGNMGETIYRITRDTKTNIKIPMQGERNEVNIFGSSVSNVKAAIRRINIIVIGARMKMMPSHFISVPMNAPGIVENFEKFKVQVLRECNNVEESLFNVSSKIHITLGVMCLMDNEEQVTASRLLTEARDKYIMPVIKEHLPLKLQLKGLSFLNDDPKAMNVLYGCVEEVDAPAGLLQRVVDNISNHFHNSGLMNTCHEPECTKMHVTLLNSKYRARQEQVDASALEPRTFDGSEILSKFSDYDFGVMELTNMHLSQCNTIDQDGYYQSTCVISCINNKDN